MAGRLKETAPHTPVILGGVFASMNADFILKDCPHADCIGVGEGEELLPDYLDHLADPGAVAGLVWRKGNEVIRNEPRALIRDLDEFLGHDALAGLELEVEVDVSSDYFRVLTDVQIGQGQARLESLLVRDEDVVRVVYRVRTPLRLVSALPESDTVD